MKPEVPNAVCKYFLPTPPPSLPWKFYHTSEMCPRLPGLTISCVAKAEERGRLKVR